MNDYNIQELLAAAGYYKGAIDGILGVQSWGAIGRILQNHNVSFMSSVRNKNAAAQLILKFANYYSGEIDGLVGNLTTGAFLEWKHYQTYKQELVLDRTPIGKPIKSKFPSQQDCRKFYGNPGAEIERELVDVPLPMEFRIDFDLDETTKRIRLHEKCAETAELAYKTAYEYYGRDRLQSLGLDRFAGSYVHRRMRGGSSWSMHAFGCAIDTWAAPNGLTTRCPQAAFCADAYKTWFDIWESLGWVSLGRAIGRDWMHVQAATL